MKNGILHDDEGYDIYVDGQKCTFRDVQAVFEAAHQLKIYSKYKDKVEVIVHTTGQRIEVDGRR